MAKKKVNSTVKNTIITVAAGALYLWAIVIYWHAVPRYGYSIRAAGDLLPSVALTALGVMLLLYLWSTEKRWFRSVYLQCAVLGVVGMLCTGWITWIIVTHVN